MHLKALETASKWLFFKPILVLGRKKKTLKNDNIQYYYTNYKIKDQASTRAFFKLAQINNFNKTFNKLRLQRPLREQNSLM